MKLHDFTYGEVDAQKDAFVAEQDAKGELHDDWSPIWRIWIGLSPTDALDGPASANDNQRRPKLKVSGIDWDNDSPF